MKYISHLDMLRLFRNAFKIAGFRLVYSAGFNPHPKLGFALPLPLGYSSSCEILEFEIREYADPGMIVEKLNAVFMEGLKVKSCETAEEGKSYASRVMAASYEIYIPGLCCNEHMLESFLKQEEITAEKVQKKTGKNKAIDIKNMIRSLSFKNIENNTVLCAELDAGSTSSLSPELLVSAFVEFAGLKIERWEINISRTGMYFNK